MMRFIRDLWRAERALRKVAAKIPTAKARAARGPNTHKDKPGGAS
jgi:hypothetical protein